MTTSKLTLLICLSFFALNGFAEATSFVGKYNCSGHDPFRNMDYKLGLSVTATGDTFTFQWQDDKGYPLAYGTGVTNKNIPNKVAIVFWDAKDKSRYGEGLYQLTATDNLEGLYTLKQASVLGSELCTRL